MASDVEEGKPVPPSETKAAGMQRKGCTTRLLNAVTAAACVLCIVAFGLAIALGPHQRNLEGASGWSSCSSCMLWLTCTRAGFNQQALRVFGILLGCGVLLVSASAALLVNKAQKACSTHLLRCADGNGVGALAGLCSSAGQVQHSLSSLVHCRCRPSLTAAPGLQLDLPGSAIRV